MSRLSISFLLISLVSFLAVVSSQQVLYPQPSPQYHQQLRSQPQPHPQSQYQQRRSPVQSHQHVPKPQHTVRVAVPQNIPNQAAPSPYVYGYRQVRDPITGEVVYHHRYNYDNVSHHEVRSWLNTEGHPTQPIVARAVSSSYEAPLPFDARKINRSPFSPIPSNGFQREVSPAPFNQQQNRRSAIKSNEISSPVIIKSSESSLASNIETIMNFIKSPNFLSQVGTLGSHSAFRAHVIGDKASEDKKLIQANIEKTGLNFTHNSDDCKPKMTTIKFGNFASPDIMFNPSSVEVLRCPQACFSWQFDCVPTKRESRNISVATYFTNGNEIERKVDVVRIDSHVECACACQSFAGCFGDTKFGSNRLQFNSNLNP